MRKSVRLTMAIVILGVSIALLAWSFLPAARELRRQRIEPTQMQVPTPSSYLPIQKLLLINRNNKPLAASATGFVDLNLHSGDSRA